MAVDHSIGAGPEPAYVPEAGLDDAQACFDRAFDCLCQARAITRLLSAVLADDDCADRLDAEDADIASKAAAALMGEALDAICRWNDLTNMERLAVKGAGHA